MPKKSVPPRRKRMKRRGRLDAACRWLPKYSGKNVVRGYAKWFGVDLGCALKELEMLGVALDPVYVAQLRMTLQQIQRVAALAREQEEVPEGYGEDWDDDLEYIAGFTTGGAPFGVPRASG
ncbi:MAG TPA: hypothetical protein VI197_08925 [Polyangiaceae bacterium]